MQIEEFYDSIGGSYKEIKARIDNEEIIRKFLKKFPDEPSYSYLLNAVEMNDINASFEAAHTLKGVVVNLSFSKLYGHLSSLLEQLRPRTDVADRILLSRVIESYEEVISMIEKL